MGWQLNTIEWEGFVFKVEDVTPTTDSLASGNLTFTLENVSGGPQAGGFYSVGVFDVEQFMCPGSVVLERGAFFAFPAGAKLQAFVDWDCSPALPQTITFANQIVLEFAH